MLNNNAKLWYELLQSGCSGKIPTHTTILRSTSSLCNVFSFVYLVHELAPLYTIKHRATEQQSTSKLLHHVVAGGAPEQRQKQKQRAWEAIPEGECLRANVPSIMYGTCFVLRVGLLAVAMRQFVQEKLSEFVTRTLVNIYFIDGCIYNAEYSKMYWILSMRRYELLRFATKFTIFQLNDIFTIQSLIEPCRKSFH